MLQQKDMMQQEVQVMQDDDACTVSAAAKGYDAAGSPGAAG